MRNSGTGDEGSKSSDRLTGVSKKGSSTRLGLLTARGTGDGLVFRLDARADIEDILAALTEYVSTRKTFLDGNKVYIEWLGATVDEDTQERVTELLRQEYNIVVLGQQQGVSATVTRLADRMEVSREESSLGLFGGVQDLGLEDAMTADDVVPVKKSHDGGAAIFDSSAWDDPDARVVYKTLRSGQKVETEHTLVVIGDVNSGAELVAGGDIIVLGSLRGVAHAGAYDETGGGRFIMAMDLQPTQLRIGSIISRGSGEGQGRSAEIARVDGNLIVVEPYSSKALIGLKR